MGLPIYSTAVGKLFGLTNHLILCLPQLFVYSFILPDRLLDDVF